MIHSFSQIIMKNNSSGMIKSDPNLTYQLHLFYWSHDCERMYKIQNNMHFYYMENLYCLN